VLRDIKELELFRSADQYAIERASDKNDTEVATLADRCEKAGTKWKESTVITVGQSNCDVRNLISFDC
jgi:hypothetical protein